jgi:hypothetical protein
VFELFGAIAWFGLQLATIVVLGFVAVLVVRQAVLDERARRAERSQ